MGVWGKWLWSVPQTILKHPYSYGCLFIFRKKYSTGIIHYSFQEELEDKVLEIKGVVRIKEDYHYNPQ